MIVHHVNKGTNVNKFARINGTNGISGAVDAQIIMTSDNGQVTLTTRGREIEMEEIPLKRIGARWECNSPEAIARELYEKDPVITFIRYLKAHSLQPNHWQQSIQYEEFRQGTNQYFGKPILNTANETGKKLRSLESDLLRYDGISATNDRSIGGKRGVIFRA